MLRFENNRISICRAMAAPPETVWDILTDTQFWPIWGPSVFDVDCQDRHIRLGSKGRVQTLFSFWLPFTVSEFRDLDSWRWRIGSYSATGHKIIWTGDTSSTLCFDMPWWAAAYLPVCWLALVRIGKIASRH
jgi:hypothetical protein